MAKDIPNLIKAIKLIIMLMAAYALKLPILFCYTH